MVPVFVGNLSFDTSDEMVRDLFSEVGHVVAVRLVTDKETGKAKGYGFVEFRGEEDADYAIKVLNMIKVYAKPVRVNKAAQDKKTQEVGANLFIGNLDPDVDEKLLYDTFSAFGVIVATPKIMRDPETGNSRGFGFVSYDCFEASDASIEAMRPAAARSRSSAAATCAWASCRACRTRSSSARAASRSAAAASRSPGAVLARCRMR